MFDYYKVEFKLTSPMLATGTQASIYQKHILEKAKKQIAKANKLSTKVAKSLEKYLGSEISEKKELMELQSLVRSFCQLIGKQVDIPNDLEQLLALNVELEEEFAQKLKDKEATDSTVFLKDEDGFPRISTHMILGNLKENLRISVLNGDTTVFKHKSKMSSTMALDVKSIAPFMTPSNDILRAESEDQIPLADKGRNVYDRLDKSHTKRVLLERPLLFDGMHGRETAIAMSEQLEAGTKFETVLRVREGSVITEEVLKKILSYGKSNGLGAWRGSGNMGAYKFKLKKLKGFTEPEDDEGYM